VREPAVNWAGEVEGQTIVGRKGEGPKTVCIPKITMRGENIMNDMFA
jgi:hypothetical protein